MSDARPDVDPHGRDDLEPPGAAGARLIMMAAVIVAFAALSAAALWGAYRWRVGHTPHVTAAAFPAPELETNQTPRATQLDGHGPGPYRAKPAEARTGEQSAPDPALESAMRREAARGGDAYEPWPAQGGS